MPRAANDVGDTARNIIATISGNSERIFQRLREASNRLADYDLVRELSTLNVSTHPCYQRRYNAFTWCAAVANGVLTIRLAAAQETRAEGHF